MTSVEGKIQLRNLKRDPRASITVDIEQADSGMGFRSNKQVKARGRARLFGDDGRWTRRITFKYLSGPKAEEAAERRAAMPRLVIELRPETLVGLASH
jgi:hypothetical protein